MADVDDVLSALASFAEAIIYPTGTAQPSITGSAVKIYPGWPQQSQLDTDLIAGIAHVTIFSTASERNTTRYPSNNWQEQADGNLIREVRRQERVFQITIWADTPTKRGIIAKAIDASMAQTQFITMPDGFGARVIYKGSPVTDGHQKAKLYRRDFLYSVEYATTEIAAAHVITQVDVNVALQPDGVDTPIATTSIHIV